MLLMKFLNLLFGGGMSGFHKLVQSSSNFFEHIQQQQISDSNRLSEPNTPFLISVTLFQLLRMWMKTSVLPFPSIRLFSFFSIKWWPSTSNSCVVVKTWWFSIKGNGLGSSTLFSIVLSMLSDIFNRFCLIKCTSVLESSSNVTEDFYSLVLLSRKIWLVVFSRKIWPVKF